MLGTQKIKRATCSRHESVSSENIRFEVSHSDKRDKSGICVWNSGYLECFPRGWYLSLLTWKMKRDWDTFDAWLLLRPKEGRATCYRRTRELEYLVQVDTRGSKRAKAPVKPLRNVHAQAQRNCISSAKVSDAPRIFSQADSWRSSTVQSLFIKTSRGGYFFQMNKS